MTSVDLKAAVARQLADLGDTADAVADRLRSLDIKGQQEDPTICPIAVYIKGNVQGLAQVVAFPSRLKFVRVDALPTFGWTPHPVAVRTFIKRFDEGVYLDLVEVAAQAGRLTADPDSSIGGEQS